MPQYSYRATDSNGNTVEGIIDALSAEAAKQSLQDMNLHPIDVSEQAAAPLPVESEIQPLDISTAETSNKTAEPVYEPIMEEVNIPEPAEQSPAMDWTSVDEQEFHTTVDTSPPLPADSPHMKDEEETAVYFPLADTLRLYAGWLLAWYALVYALGHYQSQREYPFRIPYVEGLLLSPLVLTFAIAAFLFLLLSGIHSKLGGGYLRGLTLSALGALLFIFYRINV